MDELAEKVAKALATEADTDWDELPIGDRDYEPTQEGFVHFAQAAIKAMLEELRPDLEITINQNSYSALVVDKAVTNLRKLMEEVK